GSTSDRRTDMFVTSFFVIYSIGSTRINEAPRLFPTQNAGGLLPLSTFTRRTFVIRGSRYSTTSLLLALTRTMRSLFMPPAQAKPALSAMASLTLVDGVGTDHPWYFSFCLS